MWIGDKKPRKDMIYAMQHAHEHIQKNRDVETRCPYERVDFLKVIILINNIRKENMAV